MAQPAPPPGPGQKPASMNRMMVMLPMLFLMGKVDWEDPNIVTLARMAFFAIQIVQVVMILYIKQQILAKKDERKIFVSPPKNPLAPAENAARIEKTYLSHEMEQADGSLRQIGINSVITSVLHFFLGVNQVLLIQSAMTPLNVWENPLFKIYIFKKQIPRPWGELLEGETETQAAAVAAGDARGGSTELSLDELITKTWEDGEDADFSAVLPLALKNPDFQTTAGGWTLLMVACGSPVDTTAVIPRLVNAGASVMLKDAEGWTALHWSAFHDRPESAQALVDVVRKKHGNSMIARLLSAESAEGKTPLTLAEEEENEEMARILRELSSTEVPDADDGIRRRKNKKESEVEEEENSVDID